MQHRNRRKMPLCDLAHALREGKEVVVEGLSFVLDKKGNISFYKAFSETPCIIFIGSTQLPLLPEKRK